MYRHNALGANSSSLFDQSTKAYLKETVKGSWYDQQKLIEASWKNHIKR